MASILEFLRVEINKKNDKFYNKFMDSISRQKRSEIMAKVRSKGNVSTEIKALKILRLHKITGWRRHLPLMGKPDFAFSAWKIAVFIDGCFWHGCPKCYRAPKSSKNYWSEKVERNKRRDRIVSRTLRRDGWKVLRVRECELKNGNLFIRKLQSFIGKIQNG
jgi:DNA mismatch endonuclease (patch repair protein)